MTAPALTETAELLGPWTLSGPAGPCALGLVADDRPVTAGSPAAPMMEVRVAPGCGLDIAGWRPIPLGLELTDADGRAVLTFERAASGGFRSTDQTWSLVRA